LIVYSRDAYIHSPLLLLRHVCVFCLSKQYIELWLSAYNTSPHSQQPLLHKMLVPNALVSSSVSAFQQHQQQQQFFQQQVYAQYGQPQPAFVQYGQQQQHQQQQYQPSQPSQHQHQQHAQNSQWLEGNPYLQQQQPPR
jgi:hypothetical protein